MILNHASDHPYALSLEVSRSFLHVFPFSIRLSADFPETKAILRLADSASPVSRRLEGSSQHSPMSLKIKFPGSLESHYEFIA